MTSALYTRIGINVFDHRDLGVQAEETGSGYGLSLGYKRYFNDHQDAWRLGIKNDIWFNSVDWENDASSMGTTDIVVVQPTVEVSYVFNKGAFMIVPSLAFGLEWNVKTDGEPTGEGPIGLLGVMICKNF